MISQIIDVNYLHRFLEFLLLFYEGIIPAERKDFIADEAAHGHEGWISLLSLREEFDLYLASFRRDAREKDDFGEGYFEKAVEYVTQKIQEKEIEKKILEAEKAAGQGRGMAMTRCLDKNTQHLPLWLKVLGVAPGIEEGFYRGLPLVIGSMFALIFTGVTTLPTVFIASIPFQIIFGIKFIKGHYEGERAPPLKVIAAPVFVTLVNAVFLPVLYAGLTIASVSVIVSNPIVSFLVLSVSVHFMTNLAIMGLNIVFPDFKAGYATAKGRGGEDDLDDEEKKMIIAMVYAFENKLESAISAIESFYVPEVTPEIARKFYNHCFAHEGAMLRRTKASYLLKDALLRKGIDPAVVGNYMDRFSNIMGWKIPIIQNIATQGGLSLAERERMPRPPMRSIYVGVGFKAEMGDDDGCPAELIGHARKKISEIKSLINFENDLAERRGEMLSFSERKLISAILLVLKDDIDDVDTIINAAVEQIRLDEFDDICEITSKMASDFMSKRQIIAENNNFYLNMLKNKLEIPEKIYYFNGKDSVMERLMKDENRWRILENIANQPEGFAVTKWLQKHPDQAAVEKEEKDEKPVSRVVLQQKAALEVANDQRPEAVDGIVTLTGKTTDNGNVKEAVDGEIRKQARREGDRSDTIIKSCEYTKDTTLDEFKKRFEEALKTLLGEMSDKVYKDKDKRVIMYVPTKWHTEMKSLRDSILADPGYNAFAGRVELVKETNIPEDGMIDEVNHVYLGKGLLNYKRILEGSGEVDSAVIRRLATYIKAIVMNPEAAIYNDPALIDKILDGTISLPMAVPLSGKWKEEQISILEVRKSL